MNNSLSRIILHARCLSRGGNRRFHMEGIKRDAVTALALAGALFVVPVLVAAILS